MKNVVRIVLITAVCILTGSLAWAHAPVATITSPTTGTVITVSGSPPWASNISFTIQHCTPSGNNQLDSVQNLNLSVNGTSITGLVGSPFSGTICNFTTSLCAIDTASDVCTATVTVPWSIPDVGPKSIVLEARHSATGETSDTEEVTVELLLVSVEYPAPPAVANAYIKSKYGKLTAGVRGCVIANIANNHAHDEKYGPKGGDSVLFPLTGYNADLIRQDVDGYVIDCSN